MENNNTKNIIALLNNAGKKSNLYLIYYSVIFILFATLSAFDIVTNFIGEAPTISEFNLVIGIIFGIIALISLGLTISYLIKPKQLLKIDFEKSTLSIIKSKNKIRNLKFSDIYFFKDNDPNLFSSIFKDGKLKIYTNDGECIKINYLTNSKLIKKALEVMLNVSEKNIYKKKSIKIFFIRIYQYLLKFSLKFVQHKEAKLLSTYEEIADTLKTKNIKKVLLVESGTITRNLLDNYLKTTLEAKNIEFSSFSDISTNPTLDNCINGKSIYLENKCEAIIAIGGGSPLDCAKGIAILVNTKKPLSKFKGVYKIHHKVPLIVAIPTTCGTGSETTFVTVITDEKTSTKFTITSNKIVPKYALLDPTLIKDLPLHFVGTTAMDAFSHALESYLNITRDSKSKKYSLEAIKLIHDNLSKVKEDPTNLDNKKKLLEASFVAGKAFSRGIVGPIHALSHALGGKYNLGHGYLNAILMPRFLNVYLFSCYKDLAEISKAMGIPSTGDVHKDAKNVVKYVTIINESFSFKQDLDMLKEEDIKSLAEKAYKESHLLYSSKHFVTKEMYEDILISLLKK